MQESLPVHIWSGHITFSAKWRKTTFQVRRWWHLNIRQNVMYLLIWLVIRTLLYCSSDIFACFTELIFQLFAGFVNYWLRVFYTTQWFPYETVLSTFVCAWGVQRIGQTVICSQAITIIFSNVSTGAKELFSISVSRFGIFRWSTIWMIDTKEGEIWCVPTCNNPWPQPIKLSWATSSFQLSGQFLGIQ